MFHVAFAVACAGAAGLLGWRCVQPAGVKPHGWWLYTACVAGGSVVVATELRGPQVPVVVWFTAASLVLAGVDVVLMRLPNVLVYPTLGVTATWLPAVAAVTSHTDVAVRVLAAGLATGSAYLVLHLLSPAGLGMGDVKFAPAIAMVMAWDSWGAVVMSSLIAFLFSAVWGLGLVLRRRRDAEMPFGPFMVAGAAAAPVVGDHLIAWWL